jgi:hypothetical protein
MRKYVDGRVLHFFQRGLPSLIGQAGCPLSVLKKKMRKQQECEYYRMLFRELVFNTFMFVAQCSYVALSAVEFTRRPI